MPALRDATVELPDGRHLAYTEWGVPDGAPVLYFHGTPGSRLWCPDEAATAAAGVRLLMPDRPGIGRSDPLPGRRLDDWPRDVEAFGDALNIPSFSVVGVSAGGPYAAACAALILERLRAVALVSSRALCQYNWSDRPEMVDELEPDDREEFDLAQTDPAAAADLAGRHFEVFASPLEDFPHAVRQSLEAAEGDRWFFQDASRKAIFDGHIQESFRQGMDAFGLELIEVFLPWGFRIADIAMPVSIWHGSQDPWVTQEHIDFQARTIPSNSVIIWPDGGHLGFVKHWGEILAAVV